LIAFVVNLPDSRNRGKRLASDDHRANAEMMPVEQEAEHSSIVFFPDNQK